MHGFLYRQIFKGLIKGEEPTDFPRRTRIIIALIASLIFITSFFSLGFYSYAGVEEGIVKRIISGFMALWILGYYCYLLRAMFKKR